ncbi:UPF0354 protein YtpQ [Sporosarcina sp. NCCP-2716]|uniref:DUF1444 domain-containing protein n=1 Tax=Sporosarcina sp. NCCP-2716 TaxID=2943679 RepID=UPI002041268A|nr:DUF1444 domain-containing protein [Sporosarcina sp. NCCP-2716]GKV69540.1 UPF0354 protein YtpQ [Sporosarcina sp. NCCP-2716]
MKSEQLVEELKKRLAPLEFDWKFDRKADKVRLEHAGLKQGMDISLPEIIAKYEQKQEAAIDEVVYTIRETFRAMQSEEQEGFDREAVIYPVIRSTSFPRESKAGSPFLVNKHTAETAVYYALDQGTTYRLIDESMLPDLGKTAQEIAEAALFNVRKLPTSVKEDDVADNRYYFLNCNDGYDASRILNAAFLKEMAERVEGHMTVSVPHQDVLIIGDIRNDTGYDVLAQMTMHFFTVGSVPITSLSFLYNEGELEPIFIMAKNRPARKGENKK